MIQMPVAAAARARWTPSVVAKQAGQKVHDLRWHALLAAPLPFGQFFLCHTNVGFFS